MTVNIKGFRTIVLAATATSMLALTACATGGGGDDTANASGKDDLSKNVYLRGVFTWWDAEEQYKLTRVSEDLYMSKVELTADGQPYEFKFADASWTPGTNCGYLGEDDKDIELGKKAMANCSSKFENFSFVPQETATYEFYLDDAAATPVVYVEKAGS